MPLSPVTKQAHNFGSAPDISQHTQHSESPEIDSVTYRSSKRKRCDCGSNFEAKIDQFISSITEWKQTTDQNLSSIKSCMIELQQQSSHLIASNTEIKKSIDSLSVKYEDLCTQLSSNQIQTEDCLERVSRIELSTEEIDRTSRIASIEIRNLPHNSNSTPEQLLCIANLAFKKLEVVVSSAEVFNIHHIPTKSEHKTILVSLNSVLIKNKILRAFRQFNKANPGNGLNSTIYGPEVPKQPIYIAEHLTAKARRLHFLAREFATQEQYKYCWTAGGRVLLRKDDQAKYIVLNSEDHLHSLKRK